MARKRRVEFAGPPSHVWARRVDRWPLFIGEDDYRRYIAVLAETVDRFGWIVRSFCLMPNHLHMLIELREPNLGRGMQWLHGHYVRHFNDRHDRKGRLFEHRYNAKLVPDEIYFATVAQYIEQNPVKAELCDWPDGWPWSSRGIAASGRCPPWLADRELRRRRDK